MNNPPNERPRTFIQLVTEDLGYCCVHALFTKCSNSTLITTRLGCSLRKTKEKKALWKQGRFVCENAEKCLAKCGLGGYDQRGASGRRPVSREEL